MLFGKEKRVRLNRSMEKKNDMDPNLDFLEKEKKFTFLKELKKEFPKSEVYLVGGAVRDLLLGRPVEDYDFIVRKVGAKDLEKFLAAHGAVILVGRTFGVFKFIPKGGDKRKPFEIALPRRDFAFGTGGYRDVEIQSDPNLPIKEDLARRDFTVNAMTIKLEKARGKWQIIDPFNGQKDLEKKIIRAVRNPGERFKEDYSRMLRGIRFACQLSDFSARGGRGMGWQIEEKTWQAIKKNISSLNKIARRVELVKDGPKVEQEVIETRVVPYEVIAKEFLKSFYYNPVRAFDLYDQAGAFKEFMPEILTMKGCPQPKNWHSEGDVWAHARLCLEKLSSKEFKKQFGNEPASTELILAALFHDLGKPFTIKIPAKDGVDRIRFNEHDIVGAEIARKICRRLKLSNPEDFGVDPEKVGWLVEHHMLLVQSDISRMRPGTIEKYFFNPKNPGQDLLKLFFADISATIPETGQSDFTEFRQMLERIKELKQLSPSKKELPKSILNGHEIMKKFDLKSSQLIGQLKAILREEQLSGRIKKKKEAIDFLEKTLTSLKGG